MRSRQVRTRFWCPLWGSKIKVSTIFFKRWLSLGIFPLYKQISPCHHWPQMTCDELCLPPFLIMCIYIIMNLIVCLYCNSYHSVGQIKDALSQSFLPMNELSSLADIIPVLATWNLNHIPVILLPKVQLVLEIATIFDTMPFTLLCQTILLFLIMPQALHGVGS